MPQSLAWTEDYDAEPLTYRLTDECRCICGTSGPGYVNDLGEGYCIGCAFDYFDRYTEIIAPPAGQKVVVMNGSVTEIRYPTAAMLIDRTRGRVLVFNNDSRTTMADWRALCSDMEAMGASLGNEIFDAGEGWDALPGVLLPASRRN